MKRIGLVGDIMLGRGVRTVLDEQGVEHIMAGVSPLLRSFDFLLGNLEAPFLMQGAPMKGKDPHLTFGLPPAYADVLVQMGFGGVTLANNHMTDFGADGLRCTLQALQNRGIQSTGAGMNVGEALRPVVVELDRFKIAFLAFNAFLPFTRLAGDKHFGVACLEQYTVQLALDQLDHSFTHIFLLPHWGIDYHPYPIPALVKLMKQWIQDNPRITGVIGHHPHLPQPALEVAGKIFVPSLGNFIFDEPFPLSRIASILCLSFDADGRVSTHFEYFRLDPDFSLVPFTPDELLQEQTRQERIRQDIREQSVNYLKMDERWIKYLLYQSIRYRSFSELKYLFTIYSPREIFAFFWRYVVKKHD